MSPSKRVLKYQFVADELRVGIAPGSEPAMFNMQNGVWTMWIIVPDFEIPLPVSDLEFRTFRAYATGQSVPLGAKFINSCLDGDLVWHCFEIL